MDPRLVSIYSKDMTQYGGSGKMRQPCKQRQCHVILAELQAAAAERAAEREAKRAAERAAKRAAEREAERDQRGAARQAKCEAIGPATPATVPPTEEEARPIALDVRTQPAVASTAGGGAVLASAPAVGGSAKTFHSSSPAEKKRALPER